MDVFSSAQTVVADNRPQIDLGSDLTICEDNATPTLNALNPGATYLWRVNGINASTIQTQAVDTSLPGVFTYEVTVTDPVTTCFIVDQKVYTINVSPAFALSKLDPTSCGTPTGSVTLQLNASTPTGGPYSFFISGPSFSAQNFDQTAPATLPFPGRLAGTYSAIVQDQVSGCTISQSIGLTDNVITSVTPTVIDPCAVTYSVAVVGGTPPYRFTFTNSGTGEVIGPSAPLPSPFISPALAAGTYILEVRDAGNCVFISPAPLVVTPNPPNVITINQNDLCDATPTLTASGATTYTWTSSVAGGIVGAATGATIQLQPGFGNVTYTVIGTGGAGCPGTQTALVNVIGAITPTITQSDACADQVILTAEPAGTFTYRWYRNSVLQPLGGQQIALSTLDNGATYRVELVNTVNGCVVPSADITAQVTGVITAAVTSTQACEDNKPFTLSATTNTTGETYSWFFNGSLLSTATTATTSQIEAGTYRVDVKKNSCVASAQIIVIKAPLPVGGLLDRVIICNDPDNIDPSTSSVDLDPGPFDAYNWFKNQLTLNYTFRVLNADSEGIFEVDITNSFGCVSRDKTEVNNECIPKIEAPNAFRPTSSQVANKEFYLFTFFITDNFQIFIYNRWGELVFESTDRNFKWNGGYKNNAGQPVPPGMYAYVVKYESSFRPDKGIQEKRGGVSVLR
jgi:large repetitive protein